VVAKHDHDHAYLSLLDEVGDHNDTTAADLPDHAPHVINAPLVTTYNTCQLSVTQTGEM